MPPISIGQILEICKQPVLQTLRDGRVFPTDRLNKLLQEGRIAIRPLKTTDNIVQLNVPLTWTAGDDARNSRETDRINLVKALLENGFDSMAFLIEEKLNEHHGYRFVMNPEPIRFSEVLGIDGTMNYTPYPAYYMVITCDIHVERT